MSLEDVLRALPKKDFERVRNLTQARLEKARERVRQLEAELYLLDEAIARQPASRAGCASDADKPGGGGGQR